MSCCGSSTKNSPYDVGDLPLLVFRFTPVPQHPTIESNAVTVQVDRPDGSDFGVWSSPDATLVKTTEVEVIDGVSTTITIWTFEMPAPFDVGSARNPWRARAESTSGIVAAVETLAWVRRPTVT